MSEGMPAENEILIPVERFDADFSDANSILAFSQLEGIPQIIIDDLKQNFCNYLAIGDTEYVPHAALFAPANSASRASTSPTYKTMDGFQMKTYQVHYTNESTGWKYIIKGAPTIDKIKLAADVVLTGVSFGKSTIAKAITFFASGVSLFQSFLDYSGLTQNQITASKSDYSQMRFVFDKINQYTATDYGNPGSEDFQVQLVTYKVTIKKIGSEVYNANSGKAPDTNDRTCNEVIKSGDFDDPWATAFKRGRQNPGYEDITYTTAGVTFTFER